MPDQNQTDSTTAREALRKHERIERRVISGDNVEILFNLLYQHGISSSEAIQSAGLNSRFKVKEPTTITNYLALQYVLEQAKKKQEGKVKFDFWELSTLFAALTMYIDLVGSEEGDKLYCLQLSLADLITKTTI